MQNKNTSATPAPLKAGKSCLLALQGRRFLCDIIELRDENVAVRFPLPEIMEPGMRVRLEIYSHHGLSSYGATVREVPETPEGSLVLQCEAEGRWDAHRSWWRVAPDFAMQVKREGQERMSWAAVNDLSLGGAQILSSGTMSEGEKLTLTFMVPGTHAPATIQADIVHISDAVVDEYGARTIGLRFDPLEPEVAKSLKAYIWRRLREMHPEDFEGSAQS
jgi:hypothetical protein